MPAALGASGKDGMPIVLSHTIDPESLQPEDFRVIASSGAESRSLCVTLRPSLAAGPTLVWAGIVTEQVWSQAGRGSACPANSKQVVRVTWTGGS